MATRFGSRYWEVRDIEGSRNRDSTVFMSLNLLFRLCTRNNAIINKNSQTWSLTNFDVNDFSYWTCFLNCGRLEASSLAYRDCNFCADWTNKQLRTLRLSWIESTFYVYRIDFKWCLETTSICIESTCIETTLYRNDHTPLRHFFSLLCLSFYQDLSGHPLGKKLSRPFQDLESYLQEVEDTEFR